jgi:hypothetical protein
VLERLFCSKNYPVLSENSTPDRAMMRDSLSAYADLLSKEPLALCRDSFVGRRNEQDESMLLQQVNKNTSQ